MKILLSSVYHISSYCGGNEQYFHYLATELIKLGMNVTYLTSKANNKSNYAYKIVEKPIAHFLGKALTSKAWNDYLRNQKPDIFHTSGSGLTLISSALILRQKKVPTFLTYQAHSNPKNKIVKIAINLEKGLIPKAFDEIITTTPNYQKILESKWSDKKITFVPLMLSPHITKNKLTNSQAKKELNFNKNKKYILFVGALSSHQYYKGVEVLINSAKLLPDNFQILIVGHGNKESYYRNLVNKNNLSSKIKFLGFLKNEDLGKYFKAADVFVLPSTSDSEGFGLVLIEAMACKTPTITTNIIGSAKWLKKENVSNLINQSDPKILAEEIIKVANNPDRQKITRAYKFALGFTAEKMAKNTLDLYKQILGNK
jgi:glycosyltransferase involved in cell wall biosynthesis